MKYIFVIFALIAACLMQSTYAVKCYQCKSWTDPECANEHYSARNKIVDCDLQPKPSNLKQYKTPTKCNKVVTKDAISSIVSRDCQFEAVGEKEDVCVLPDNREVVSCMVCKGDICNGSSGSSRFVAAGLMTMLAFVVAKYLL